MLKRKPKAGSPFNDLVREALKVAKEFQAFEAEWGKHYKLTSKAFLEEALNNAGASLEKVKEFRADLHSKAKEYPNIWHFIVAMKRDFAEQQGAGLGCFRPPTENLHPFAAKRDMVPILTELTFIPSKPSVLDLVAVASLWATEEAPEAFGYSENWEATEKRLTELSERRKELLERIGQEFEPSDLDYVEAAGGLAKVTFRCSGGSVPVAPRNSAGERLLNHLLARPELEKAFLK